MTRKDVIYLGPTPGGEECAQLGEGEDYELRAADECDRYIELIRRTVGVEPKGTRLKTKWMSHDFGRYCEVICEFDPTDERALTYATKVDLYAPMKWDDTSKERDIGSRLSALEREISRLKTVLREKGAAR